MTKIKKQLLLTAFILTAIVPKTYAVRPFITDDGLVAGKGVLNYETWAYIDREVKEHWTQFSFGATERLEFSAVGLWGFYKPKGGDNTFSYSLPLLEAKYLFCEFEPAKRPGIAAAAGSHLPWGKGEFVPSGRGAYGFLAASYALDENENFTFHGNFGMNYLYVNKENDWVPYWGLGSQVRAYKGLHIVGEVISGDPYAPGTGLAYQLGIRQFINEKMQFDIEFGQGLAGEDKIPFWVGFGFRMVIDTKRAKK